MRLIDADALNARLSRDATPYYTACDIDSAPTIDAVPVVRCKDCMYWDKGENDAESWEWCKFFKCNIGPYAFCFYGERKDNDQD